jgi:prepilin-type N-terminal cleavage/methylation domain-containing protein
MLNKLKKSNNEGFTIIEVMIVLAIAGLILLIVLLAVPALNRNSHNTAIKNDASSLASAVQEYKSNNDGGQPTAISAGPGAVQVTGAAGTAQATAQLGPSTSTSSTQTPAVGALGYQLNNVCPNSTSPANRTVAIYYRIESTSATAVYKCVEA